jgi:hypothetical protein
MDGRTYLLGLSKGTSFLHRGHWHIGGRLARLARHPLGQLPKACLTAPYLTVAPDMELPTAILGFVAAAFRTRSEPLEQKGVMG